jgi:predicted amidophosphoribosyltransferase
MNAQCVKCGAHLSSPWKFCPQCGTAFNHEFVQHAPVEHEKAPMKYAFSGLLFGLLVAPMMLIVGTMLCMTGLGAIAGAPMIVGGILAPLLGPMIGMGSPKGKCPWCGTAINNFMNAAHFHCHACSQGVAVEDQRFVKAA